MLSPAVTTARRATYAVFALAGLQFAALACRIPDLKRVLALSPGQLGITLLAVSAGSLVGLPVAGAVVRRIGTGRTVGVGALLSTGGLAGVGLAVEVAGSRAATGLALAFVGLGVGLWDVAMNLEGAAVEQAMGRSIMPRFHAAFSLGTVVGAGSGAVVTAVPVGMAWHLGAVAAMDLAIVALAMPHLRHVPGSTRRSPRVAAVSRRAWREPRTLLVGVVTLVAAFTEGTANDWLAVAVGEGHALAPWAGPLALGVFLTGMTAGRVAGTAVIDRYGRVAVLRACFALAFAGSALVALGGPLGTFAGALIWGAGSSLGFPLGMSAAADDPAMAPARVSVVSTIGYLAFLAGPPMLGAIADRVGPLHALLVVGALAGPALLAVPALREPRPRRPQRVKHAAPSSICRDPCAVEVRGPGPK